MAVSEDDTTFKSSNKVRKPKFLELCKSSAKPALLIGGLAGISGIIFGGFAGVIRSTTPALFALASGVQWFILGGTFWASRSVVFQGWGLETASTRDKIFGSAISGCAAGAAGGLLRGRRNIIPGAFIFSVFGAVGQATYDLTNARNSRLENTSAAGRTTASRWLNSTWSPIKILSDNDYEVMLQERLLRINAEIALVDENIEHLSTQKK